MPVFSIIYKTFIDALFPLSGAERELFLLPPKQAYEALPPMQGYQGLAVPLLNTDSIFAYKDERVAKLIWNIKYKKSSHAVQIGGYALWRELPKCPKNSLSAPAAPTLEPIINIIIPMPITNRRRKERGYNQCELLTDEIERLDTNRQFIIEKNLLVRTHHLDRQTLKGRKDRVESSQGIFGVNEEIVEQLKIMTLKNSENINNNQQLINDEVLFKTTPIIIIDDVITTGSTMYEAIETLKKVGFENVCGLSLAH